MYNYLWIVLPIEFKSLDSSHLSMYYSHEDGDNEVSLTASFFRDGMTCET